MAERSDEIRHEIEQTRERMGETVDALGHKADVPGRAREWASEKKEAVVSRVAGATPDPEAIRHRGRRARQTAREKGREQGEELSSSLQEKAKEVAPQQPETRPS